MLAIHGGSRVRDVPFAPRITMGEAERRAVAEVMESDVLSAYLGGPGDGFLGGPRVREFEERWAAAFGYRHAITTNSWSTGLMTCIGSLALEPGDEMICPPYTMSATATAALFYGVVPVFADVEPETFGLDPASVEKAVTDRTRAIMVVHLFGTPAKMTALLDIARRHDLRVIEDAAQAPLATYDGRPVGGQGDLGGFSLNYHKHIHTGEGGVIVTDDDDLALRCQLIRNHGENIVESHGVEDLANTIGSNYRLTELQAAIGIEQLKRLPGILDARQQLADHLASALAGRPGLDPLVVPPGRRSAYYGFPIRYDEHETGIPRSAFVDAVNAELPPPETADQIALSGGYTRPLYLNPAFQQRVAIGSGGWPFSESQLPDDAYAAGTCPTAEDLYERGLVYTMLAREPLDPSDVDDFVRAVDKVLEHADDLNR